jgi:hypothetical protein
MTNRGRFVGKYVYRYDNKDFMSLPSGMFRFILGFLVNIGPFLTNVILVSATCSQS